MLVGKLEQAQLPHASEWRKDGLQVTYCSLAVSSGVTDGFSHWIAAQGKPEMRMGVTLDTKNIKEDCSDTNQYLKSRAGPFYGSDLMVKLKNTR